MTQASIVTKEQIRKEAMRLGFDACGFARAEPVADNAVEWYDSWLSEGKNDCMNYAANHCDLRNDPRNLLDDAKTVISVALNYYPSQFQSADVPQFSYYAYGRDYHEVVRERLGRLSDFLATHFQASSRACVDTAPIREKYWAQRAGIGMIGRNNLLIIPGKGSFFFLGELVTTIELPPDEPCTATCGDCRLCEQNCPTGALLGGVALDARRCLSCQLIERRGELSADTISHIGNHVYGCDACQLICPHNSHATATQIADFTPSEKFLSLDKKTLMHLSHDEFLNIFRHSAVRRAKLEGLQRNADAIK